MEPDNLIEYLYVDEKRLDSYFEQISEPVAYDKVPIWRIALGLTGPQADGTQSRPARPFTRHEKASKLVEYLKKRRLVVPHRPWDRERWDAESPFRLESMDATRIYIPPREASQFNGLTVWFSGAPDENPEKPSGADDPTGPLYLLQDYQVDDEIRATNVSAASALKTLFYEIQGERSEIIINGKPDSLLSTLNSRFPEPDENTFDRMFSSDPESFLTELGARVVDRRFIQCLYRVRRTLNDYYSVPIGSVVTIGYPIVIAEGDL